MLRTPLACLPLNPKSLAPLSAPACFCQASAACHVQSAPRICARRHLYL